jgi:tight adherence protein B
VAGGFLGLQIAGPAGVIGGAAAGWAIPRTLERRRGRRRLELLERQLSDLVETTAGAVRSGLSIAQALEFAAAEAAPPMRGLVDEFRAERALGTALEEALDRFGDAVGTDEARMFVLILSIHVKSGGNLAAPLQEVASTIHHRTAVRRELRALTAQGRVSGAILGGLPIAFFLVLSATSRHELGPIYRSAAGIAMLAAGLGLEGVAYLWIRRLMRVQA